VAGSTESSKEEKSVPAAESSKVTLTIDINSLALAVHTLGMDQFVVLECHILCNVFLILLS
jgi:hypothetical protein